MEAVRDRWTDERLDDLNGRVSEGFQRIDARFAQIDARFAQIDARFAQIDARLDAINRSMMQGLIALVGIQVTGFAAILGFIATQT